MLIAMNLLGIMSAELRLFSCFEHQNREFSKFHEVFSPDYRSGVNLQKTVEKKTNRTLQGLDGSSYYKL